MRLRRVAGVVKGAVYRPDGRTVDRAVGQRIGSGVLLVDTLDIVSK